MIQTKQFMGIVVGVLATLVVACSSDSSGTGSGATTGDGGAGSTGAGSCSPTSGGTGGAKCDAYTACVESKCDSNYVTCFGAGYKSGNFGGGSCSTYEACAAQCKCGDSTYVSCVQACSPSSDCTSCLTAIGSCAQSNCSAELSQCSGTGSAGDSGTGATTGSHTCAQLAACCPNAGAEKDGCNQAVSTGIDSICDSVYGPIGCK